MLINILHTRQGNFQQCNKYRDNRLKVHAKIDKVSSGDINPCAYKPICKHQNFFNV